MHMPSTAQHALVEPATPQLPQVHDLSTTNTEQKSAPENLTTIILSQKADITFLISEKKPFIIMLHTSWCPACIQAEGELPKILHHFNGSVALYSIDLEQADELVTEMENAGIITQPVTAIPTFILINPDTNAHDTIQGFPGSAKIITLIEDLIKA